jgi:hypothetical protein
MTLLQTVLGYGLGVGAVLLVHVWLEHRKWQKVREVQEGLSGSLADFRLLMHNVRSGGKEMK